MARKAAIIGGGVIACVLCSILVACQSNVRDYSAPPRTSEEKALAASCATKGGHFARFGFAAAGICELPKYPAKDAGKACTDGSQCDTGTCLAATRSCAPAVHEWYCEPILEHGKKVDVLCPD